MSSTTSLVKKLEEQFELPNVAQEFIKKSVQYVGIPMIGILVFLFLWSIAAQNIDTSLGKFPGPSVVMEQFGNLYEEHQASREKEAAFYERQDERNAKRMEADPNYVPKVSVYRQRNLP